MLCCTQFGCISRAMVELKSNALFTIKKDARNRGVFDFYQGESQVSALRIKCDWCSVNKTPIFKMFDRGDGALIAKSSVMNGFRLDSVIEIVGHNYRAVKVKRRLFKRGCYFKLAKKRKCEIVRGDDCFLIKQASKILADYRKDSIKLHLSQESSLYEKLIILIVLFMRSVFKQ